MISFQSFNYFKNICYTVDLKKKTSVFQNQQRKIESWKFKYDLFRMLYFEKAKRRFLKWWEILKYWFPIPIATSEEYLNYGKKYYFETLRKKNIDQQKIYYFWLACLNCISFNYSWEMSRLP